MTTSRPPSKPMDLDITIVSAKHLKNVNWRHGDLKPYAIFWTDPDHRLATKSDDSGSTSPVWNERFLLPISHEDSLLTLEIFHSKPLDTPKPLVAILRFPLKQLNDSHDSTRLKTFELRRPSGRPHGKIRLKLSLRDRPLPNYQITPQPQPNYYYLPPPSTSLSPPPPPPPPPHQPHSYSYSSYSDPYSGYYPGYYSQPPPPPPPRPFLDRQSSSGGPSAPEDYTPYEQRPKSGKMGLGTGLAVGAVAGALGGLVIEEGVKFEEEKVADRVERERERERDLGARDDYSDYRYDY